MIHNPKHQQASRCQASLPTTSTVVLVFFISLHELITGILQRWFLSGAAIKSWRQGSAVRLLLAELLLREPIINKVSQNDGKEPSFLAQWSSACYSQFKMLWDGNGCRFQLYSPICRHCSLKSMHWTSWSDLSWSFAGDHFMQLSSCFSVTKKSWNY